MTPDTPDTRDIEKPSDKHMLATIVERHDITDELFKLRLQPDEPLPFEPGQYCVIGAQGLERPYSIVSSPNEPQIELFIELVAAPTGHLTPVLHQSKVGDKVTLRRKAKGRFLFQPKYKNHVMVATVTGISPFISMLRTRIGDTGTGHHFLVMLGASFIEEFGYDGELEQMAVQHKHVDFVASCSRPDEPENVGWIGETGRINTLIEKYLDKSAIAPQDTIIYACGNPHMIEDVKKRFEDKAYAFSKERFWTPSKNDRDSD